MQVLAFHSIGMRRLEALLTEEAVRTTFEPHFQIERFGEYTALPAGGTSAARMHWSVFSKRPERRDQTDHDHVV